MRLKKILLMGNPNVGKSVIFSRLTGIDVISSNYPGTTVEFTKGIMHIGNEPVEIIDAPGAYTLEPTTKTEEIAVKILDETFSENKEEAIVINVVDATNLERSLLLTLQLVKRNIPMIAVLNFWDETKHTGININVEELENYLQIPCIPTTARTGFGIKKLVDTIKYAKRSTLLFDEKDRWQIIGDIIKKAQRITHRHHTLLERFGDFSVMPVAGIVIGIIITISSFYIIRALGEGIISNISDPLFDKLWTPIMLKISNQLGSEGIIHNILIGKLIDGKINYGESFGLMTTGLYVPFAAVLPYIFSFYLLLSILEDIGYLPRFAIVVDNLMHRVGLHGYGIIPMALGLGCNVPGILATRNMETKRERFISAVLLSIAVPCAAKSAMIIGLIGKHGIKGLILVFGTLFVVWLIIGILLNKFLKGHTTELFIEIPPYRIPYLQAVLKKLWMRIVGFLKESVIWVLVGVFLVNIFYVFGIIDFISKIFQPILSKLFGLPSSAAVALIIGFLRKDVAVGMLIPLHLTLKQLVISCVVLSMYFPCVATFTVLLKDLGIKDTLKAILIMITATVIVGSILNFIL